MALDVEEERLVLCPFYLFVFLFFFYALIYI